MIEAFLEKRGWTRHPERLEQATCWVHQDHLGYFGADAAYKVSLKGATMSRLRIFEVCEALHALAPPERPDTNEELEQLRALPCLGVTVWDLVLELYRWRDAPGHHETEYGAAFASLMCAVLGEFGE